MTYYSKDAASRFSVIPKMRFSKIFPFIMLFVFWKIPVAGALTPEEIAKNALDATVLINMVDASGKVASRGSGFFVQRNLIVTNFHLINGLTRGGARVVGQEITYPIEKINVEDEKRNLAILQVSAPGIEPLPIGNSESVAVGDQVYVIGNPLGVLEGTFSGGIISAIREVDGVKLFQVTAPISEGNSGGPVLNAQGEVIGVSQGIVPAGENLNFAIHSIYLKTLVNQLGQKMLQSGIELYEASQFEEAIKSLESALHVLSDPEGRALAQLYLGCSKRGFGESDLRVSAEFREALRHKPNQALPPRIGEDHPVFKLLLEKVRSESTGELTVTCSLPQTEIWIDGNDIERTLIGTGTATVRLFVGGYIVEGVFEAVSRKESFTIVPDGHKILYLELPPILKHEPPARASVGEIIPLSLDLISRAKSKQVQIHYIIYDRNGDELDQGNQEMLLWKEQPTASTWIYRSDLPSQTTVGKISYFIMADEARSPKEQYHEIYIVDENFPEIVVLEPHESAEFKVNQPISVRARVTDNTAVDEVRIHYAFSSLGSSKPSEATPSQPLEKETSDDIYAGLIPPQQRGTGYIWYYLTATDEEKNESKSDERKIEIVHAGGKLLSPKKKDAKNNDTKYPFHQGIWVSHGWSENIHDNGGLVSQWDRGDILSFSYLSEGKGYRTLGVKIDFSYHIPTNTSATVQWWPAMRQGSVGFALLGGVARYRDDDSGRLQSSWAGADTSNESNHIMPFLGASLKLYPMDTVTFDIASSIKLGSVDTFSSEESNSIAKHLHHYEMGIRVYITPALNLRLSYGKWYLGDRGNTTVQVGVGVTF